MDDKEREALTTELETVDLQLAGVQEMMEQLDRTRTALRDRLRQITVALVADPVDVAEQVADLEATLGVKFVDLGTEALEKKKPPVIDPAPVDVNAFPNDRISAEVAAERAAAKEIPHG